MKTKFLLTKVLLLLVVTVFGQNTNTGTNAGNSGSNNTSIGYYAGDVVTGSNNSFLGYYAGKLVTSGTSNTFLGSNAGQSLTTGSYNSFVGYNSGVSATGNMNVFMGYFSGTSNTGDRNAFFGAHAGGAGSGSYNVLLGNYAGDVLTSGNNNVFVGYKSGFSNGTGTGNIFVGYQSGYFETGSDKLYIDNSDTATPLIYGDFLGNKLGINSLPNTTHTLTVGGTIHSTGLYVNGVLVSGDLSLWERNGSNVFTQSTSDNIGIGTTLVNNPNSYKLAVNGKIGAKEVQIENTSLTWPDFVFKSDYKLMNLAEVEAFIKANGHLPEVPSEKQVAEEGIKVSELNAMLLQKIEELTLHLIELKKEVDALKNGKK